MGFLRYAIEQVEDERKREQQVVEEKDESNPWLEAIEGEES
jgi:hypothetical protein